MKKERIDEVLIRLGYVTEDQIARALTRQRSRGGRIGSHLLFYGSLVEEQLVHALSVQHNVPGFHLGEHVIDVNLVDQYPGNEARRRGALPLVLDGQRGELTAAVADPSDKKTIHSLKNAFGVKHVRTLVAPEALLNKLIAQHYDLPAAEADTDSIRPSEVPDGIGITSDRARPVLLITAAQGANAYLGPVFEREGYDLRVVSDVDKAAEAIRETAFERIIVGPDCLTDFNDWLNEELIDPGTAEVARVDAVSETLMNNPAPYKRVTRSLLRSLQIIAEGRCSRIGWIPPYLTLADDVARLARRYGLDRVAVDGLRAASYLLLPGQGAAPSTRSGGGRVTFIDTDKSLEIARTLHFPWDIRGVLERFLELLSLNGDMETGPDDISLGAQFLALVWFRHISLADLPGGSLDSVNKIKTRLRGLAGKLASLDVIDAYVGVLEDEAKAGQLRPFNQVFIVGKTAAMPPEFVSRMKRAGFKTLLIEDIAEALRLCERQAPGAVLVHRESFPKQMTGAGSAFRQTAIARLFAFSNETAPSTVLDMLDAGFDDVFVPPHDYDIIAARVTRSLTGVPGRKSASRKGTFAASFEAFAFIDLIQALGQSRRSVRINLRSGSGEIARVLMDRGRLVHAVCGKLTGEQAIYAVVAWGEDGDFDVEPQSEFPEPNISEPNEGILMQGCRLLDESTA